MPIGRTTVTRRAPRHSAGLGVWVAPDGIPSGCAVFSTDLIMQQRFMDPQHQVIFQLWLELKLLVDDLRAFFRDLSDAIKDAPPLLVDTGVIIGFMHVRCSIRAFSARHVVGDKISLKLNCRESIRLAATDPT